MTDLFLREQDARWQRLVELRARQEIVGRWLETKELPELLREQLRLQLQAIEQELRAMELVKGPEAVARMREAS